MKEINRELLVRFLQKMKCAEENETKVTISFCEKSKRPLNELMTMYIETSTWHEDEFRLFISYSSESIIMQMDFYIENIKHQSEDDTFIINCKNKTITVNFED